MSQQDVKLLRNAVTELNARYEELREFSFTISLSKKLELLDQLELLNIKITRLESVLNHIEAATVEIQPPTDQDKKELQDAMAALSEAVKADLEWAQAVKLTKSLLTAARTISDNVTIRTSG